METTERGFDRDDYTEAEKAELLRLRAEMDGMAPTWNKGGARQYRAADLRQAVAHGLRQGFGLPVQNTHPLVGDMRRADGTIDLIAAAALAVEARTGQRPELHGDGFNILAQGLTTADFPDLMRQAMTAFVRSRPSDDLALLQAVARRIDVQSYHPITHAFAGFEALPQPDAHTSAQYNILKPRFAAEPVQVHTSSDMLLLSRQAATDGEAFGVLEALASGYVTQALGTQVGMLAALLESNQELSDGSAWFLPDVNTVQVSPSLTEVDLAAMMRMLREQSRILRAQADPGGNVLDARLAALLVPANFEVLALRLVETLPRERRPVVYASARLSGDYVFAFADPAQHPSVARVLMQGAPDTGVNLGSLRSAEVWDAAQQRDVSFPGFGLDVSHSVAFSPLSRSGIVRGTFSE